MQNLKFISLVFINIYFNICFGITIQYKDKLQKNDTITTIISLTKQGNLVIQDSINFYFDKNTQTIDVGNYKGYAELHIKQYNKNIGFIINPLEKNLILELSKENIKEGKIEINNSKDNKIYMTLVAYKNKFDKELIQARMKKFTLSRLDSFYLSKLLAYERQFEENCNQLNIICDSVLKYDSTLYTSFLADFLKVPTSKYLPISKKYFDNYDALLHWHYFDFINFNNPLILNHPALGIKIRDYLNDYVDNNNLSQNEAIDLLMRKSALNPQLKEFIFNTLIDYFLAINIDPAVSYIYEKYADGCGLQLSAQQIKEVSGIVNTNIGSTIPKIVLNDTRGDLKSLESEIEKNKYTIVYVWMSSCHACQTKTPILEQIVSPYLKKGLGVYTISLDEKKENWFEAVVKYKIQNWTNVCELTTIQKSTILSKLNIRTTPKLFIIDKSGKIVAKDIFGDALSSKLIELLK